MMMNDNINTLVWNSRGAGKRNFSSFMKDLRGRYGFSILVLLEIRLSGCRANKVAKKFCFDGSFRVDADGFAGGIWVFWDSSLWNVSILCSGKQFVHMSI